MRGVVASLLVCGLVLGACSSKKPDGFEARLEQALRSSAQAGGTLKMEDATDFAWDTLHVVGPYVTAEEIHRQLGFEWSGATNQDFDSHTLLIFTQGQKVVKHLDFPRGKGDFAEMSGKHFTREDARFLLKLDDGRIRVSPAPPAAR